MEITNDERREVARKLRHVVNCCDQEPYYGVPDSEVFSILGVGLGATNGFANEDDVERLADLIDRPTCHLEWNDLMGCWECSNCGETWGNSYDEDDNKPYFKYCSMCDAEVQE